MENESKKRKKYLIILILRILETYTDINNPLTQTKIADIISQVYPCERKTVGRNIQYLKELGYPIRKTSKGFYMDYKVFTVDEVNFIKNLIMNSNDKTYEEKINLCDKINLFFNKKYKK